MPLPSFRATESEQARESFSSGSLERSPDGSKWRICLIEAGMSLNKFFYDKEVLRAAASKFEGVKVFAHKYGDTLDHRPEEVANPLGLVENLVGFVKNVQMDDAGSGRLMGDFHVANSAIRDLLTNIWETDRKQMPGFSVDIMITRTIQGDTTLVTGIPKVNSLDMVTSPAAGGQFERLVASIGNQKKETQMPKILLQLLALARAGVISTKESIKDVADEVAVKALESQFSITDEMKKWTDEQVGAFVKTLLVPAPAPAKESAPPAPAPAPVAPAPVAPGFEKRINDLQETLKQTQSLNILEGVLAKESVLSDESKGKVRASLEGKVFDLAGAFAAVKAEKEYVEHVLESNAPKSGFIKIVAAPHDKMVAALDLLVDPELARAKESQEAYKGVVPFRGLKEALKRMDGVDYDEFLAMSPIERRRAIESTTTASFAVTLGDSMNKRLVREYSYFREREIWTKFVTEEDFTNLNEQKLLRLGGFQDLDTVAEAGTYQETNTPSETNPVYTPVKKGNIFVLTEEMIINDDLRAIRAFPAGMARAASRTLSRFVYNLLTGSDGSDNVNSKTIYDSKALYHNDHGGNIGASALSNTTFDTACAVMMNQTQDTGSDEPLGIRPKFLVIPPTLRRLAWDASKNELVQANSNGGSIQNALKEYGVEPLVVPDGFLAWRKNCWYLIGDPMDAEGIRVGYLSGKRSPEILLQDQPVNGNVFTNDKLTYKVKFRYGGAVVDYRPFYAGIVAG